MSHLKPVLKPGPDSLTPEERLLLLQRGDPNGPIRLDCWPARPYLAVVSNERLELEGTPDSGGPPGTGPT